MLEERLERDAKGSKDTQVTQISSKRGQSHEQHSNVPSPNLAACFPPLKQQENAEGLQDIPSTSWPPAKGVHVCPQHGLEKGIGGFGSGSWCQDMGMTCWDISQPPPQVHIPCTGYCRALPLAVVGPHDGLWNKKPADISFQVYLWGKNPGTEILLLVIQADLCHFGHFYGSWAVQGHCILGT